jgi:hypothetical protein
MSTFPRRAPLDPEPPASSVWFTWAAILLEPGALRTPVAVAVLVEFT